MPKPCLALRSSVPAVTCAAMLVTAPAAFAAPTPSASLKASSPATPPPGMSSVGGERLALPGTQVNTGAGVPTLPKDISARSWIVSDAETGEVLAAHNAHWRLPPASTMKMLFADTVLPKLDKNAGHKVTAADLSGLGAGSSLVGIKENLTYTVHDLWLGVFLRSGNDAVQVLSKMNGGVDSTVLEMNAKAKDLQANDTNVVSPDGYDMPGQTSSAYDLTLFARAGLQNPDFRAYCSTVTAQFPGGYEKNKKGKDTRTRATFQIQNTNRLLTGTGVPVYKGIAGVKNGYTTKAGNTFTGVAQQNGRTLLVTVMHPAPGYDEVYKEAAKLLDWGFAADGKVTPVGTLVAPLSQQRAVSPSASASPSPGAATGGVAAAASAAGAPSSRRGLLTALGITAGALLLLGGLGWFVRKRWPLPAATGGTTATATGTGTGTDAGTDAAKSGGKQGGKRWRDDG